MLSKINSSALVETRSSVSHTSNLSDNEEELENDTNNNNNNSDASRTFNNQQSSKKTQDELLDIVEVSRERRLSKESADLLTGFIKWSFSHVDPSIQRRLSESPLYTTNKGTEKSNRDKFSQDEDMLDDTEDDWSLVDQEQYIKNNNNNNDNNININNNGRFQVPEQLLRQHAKLSEASSGSTASNLASMKGERRMSPSSLFNDLPTRLSKRPRTQVYSPESRPSNTLLATNNPRKTSNYLGNVVDRLHQQQQQQLQQQQQQQPPAQVEQQQDNDPVTSSNTGLSFHLQQFLQQQTSLEDLCSSFGLDDSNQLVLAAAIHRALVDSVGPTSQSGNGSADGGLANDTKSSIESLTGLGNKLNNNSNNLNNQTINASGANLDIIDPLTNRQHQQQQQRRAYNTRAALHGLTSGSQQTTTNTTLTSNLNNRQNIVSAMNMSNRVQQQRHAQAVAALSALATAGAHHSTLSSATQPIVDFKCDTCPSSFDDRHRLMQHQSIHLELKKDWFTEKPVDEVMKIFNRRRGEFLCNICNLRFEATLDYDQHNHQVHGPRPYCCQFCGNGTRTFKCWRQYLNHLYDHRYIFSCTIDDCDFSVNRRDSLRFHIFRCHLNCQLPQNQQQQLRSVSGNPLSMVNSNGNDHHLKW